MKNTEPHQYAYKISPDDLNEVWCWILQRQGVGRELKFDSVAEIADKSFGLHAARLSSPFVTALSRSSEEHTPTSLFNADTRNSLTTVRCMRKTLHILPLPLASAAHSATLHFRERDALRQAVNAQMSARVLANTVSSIVYALEEGVPLSHRDLESRLCTSRLGTHAVRAALKLAWERGIVTYRNESGGWNKERRTFALTHNLYPGFNINKDREEATTELIHHYFERYGPASLRDAMWWSGLSRSAIVAAMNSLHEQWVSISSPWCESPLYMLPSRLEEFYERREPRSSPFLNFLAHEDVALKAYSETRPRYLGTLEQRRIFNQIGEVLPAIIQDGKVVGRWSWDTYGRHVNYGLFDEYKARIDTMQLRSLQQKYTGILRSAAV